MRANVKVGRAGMKTKDEKISNGPAAMCYEYYRIFLCNKEKAHIMKITDMGSKYRRF